MDISEASAEDLMYWLAVRAAEDQFEVNRNIYQDDSEAYANEGVTESSYMRGGVESLEWYCNEQIPETVFEQAKKHYAELVAQKYGKKG